MYILRMNKQMSLSAYIDELAQVRTKKKEFSGTNQPHQIVLLVMAVIVLVMYLYRRFTGVDILQNALMIKPLIHTLPATADALSGI